MIHQPATPERPTLVLTRALPAPPERVWRAWTQPEQIARWFGPEGMDAEVLAFSPTVGGAYRIRFPVPEGMQDPDAAIDETGSRSFTVFGEYTELDPPRRMVCTWVWESPGWAGKHSTVTIELEPAETDEGPGTLLTLTHADLLDEDAKQSHGEGWGSTLNRLERLLG